MTPLHDAFLSRIRVQFPADAEQFIAAIEREPQTSVRLNTRKVNSLPSGVVASNSVPWCADACWLTERPNFTLIPSFHAGAFYPQEASSMFVAHILRHIEGELPSEPVVLDLCAAPGGKSTLVLEWLGGRGLLVSNEIVRQRAWILRENIAKWGSGNCIVTNTDAAHFGSLGALFDLVVIDAPCSGEGMFRKDDVARTEWSPENARMCAERQHEILSDVWDSIAENGVVIYSTCTFNPDENERQMEWLLENFDAEVVPIPIDESWGVTTLPFNGGEGYAFHPHKVSGEGFFACAIRKRGFSSSFRKPKLKPQKVQLPTPCLSDAYNAYLFGDEMVALPKRFDVLMLSIADRIKPLLLGIPVGKPTRKEFIPAPELALQFDFEKSSFPHIELSHDDILRYLRGEWSAQQELPQGWCVVCHDGLSYGFIKVIGNRVNNYWPKEWRIRMNL